MCACECINLMNMCDVICVECHCQSTVAGAVRRKIMLSGGRDQIVLTSTADY